ncbi:CoA-binding protein [Micrococcales bacterium 31B]|nr:CoA-binding protein [Micrococcales bacterium 31B]
MPQQANDEGDMIRLLTTPARWAVVGLSTNADRVAHRIAARLLDLGMEIVPVHPRAETVFGSRGYATLAEVPGHLDVVDLFVASHRASDIIDQAIAVGADAVWLQRGVHADAAVERARAAGLTAVLDTCPAIEAERLLP